MIWCVKDYIVSLIIFVTSAICTFWILEWLAAVASKVMQRKKKQLSEWQHQWRGVCEMGDELLFNSILVVLLLFMVGLLFFAFANDKERELFKTACEKHNGAAVHDGRQWQCLKRAQVKGN